MDLDVKCIQLKCVALAFKLSVLKKTHIWTPLKCRYLLMILFYSETKKMKYFLDPPQKKTQGYERSRTWLHAYVPVYSSSL